MHFLTTCLIIYRRKLSKLTITSISSIQLGLLLVTLDKVLTYYNDCVFWEKITWISAWITSILGIGIILVESYVKAIRYNPNLKKLFVILLSIILGCILLFIFFSIMEMITI